jgi:hypothetical protein
VKQSAILFADKKALLAVEEVIAGELKLMFKEEEESEMEVDEEEELDRELL